MRAPLVRRAPPNTALEKSFTAADVHAAVVAAGTISFISLENKFGFRGALLQTLASLKRQRLIDYNADWRTLDNLVVKAL